VSGEDIIAFVNKDAGTADGACEALEKAGAFRV